MTGSSAAEASSPSSHAPRHKRQLQRREQLLAAATRLFNRHSFATVTLEAFAREVGVTPSTLYHHFDNKEALVYECFRRGVDLYRHEIDRACEPGLEGLETVRRFVRGRLRPGEPRMITFSDVDALPKVHRETIRVGRIRNADRLASIIEAGVQDGSIARCNPFLTSLAIFSVLDWMPSWYTESRHYTRQEAADWLDDIIVHGIVRRDHPETRLAGSAEEFASLVRTLASADRRTAKRDRLLRFATASFNQRGVVGSSIEQIAQDAGVSRSAYYYHAKDKTTLLYLCLMRAYENEHAALDDITRAAAQLNDGIPAVIHVETRILRAVEFLHNSSHGPKISFHNVPYLAPEQHRRILARNSDIVARNHQRYRDAIDAGVFRKLDLSFIQEVGAGMRNNIPTWAEVARQRGHGALAETYARVFLFGLKPRRVTAPPA